VYGLSSLVVSALYSGLGAYRHLAEDAVSPAELFFALWALAGASLVLWLWLIFSDPGRLPLAPASEYPRDYLRFLLAERAEVVCATCRIVQPLRCKHCR
jgi:hypothetical protein